MISLLDGLREILEIARRRPELAQRVHDHPSGFILPRECAKDCAQCRETHGLA
jgi:hypothetical protein